MKALVLSDTHVKREEDLEQLKDKIEPLLSDVEVIIHAGDSVSMYLVDYLRSRKLSYIARGNMDSADVASILPDKQIVEFAGHRIGLTHGYGTSCGLLERVYTLFSRDDVDAIVFGHSHRPYISKHDGVLLVNPGSPTHTRLADRNTVVIITAHGELTAELIDV